MAAGERTGGTAGRPLDCFLRPGSVAVVGASDDETRIGGRTLFNLRRGGFTGPIYPINPRRSQVQGLPAFPSLHDVPDTIDVVVIAVPGEQVIPAMEAAADRGARGAVIFSAGFNEAGPGGVTRQAALDAIVARSGMRVIGPNCLGAYNARNGTWLSFTTQFQEPVTGPAIGMVSQSGGSAAHILKLAQNRGLAIGTFITTGNESDVEFGEALTALAGDPDTNVILAYIEGIRNRTSFLAGLEAARRAAKPVIVLKVGRTAAGAQAAASHTASLAGEDAVYEMVFRTFGVHRARSTEELLDVAGVAVATADRRVTGNALGVVTISGGMGAQIADEAAEAGLVLTDTDADEQTRLKALCPPGSPRNPVDITAQLSTDPALLANSLRILLESGRYDLLFAFFGVYANVPALSGPILADLRQLRIEFPAAVIGVGVVCAAAEQARYADAGLLVFEEPARAVRAMAALPRFAAAFARPSSEHRPESRPAIDADARFDEVAAKALLKRIGIAAPREASAADPHAAASAAREIDSRVALKIVSADLLHKSDVGGVALDLRPEQVGAAAERMLAAVRAAAPQAKLDGFMLSEMAPAGISTLR